MVASITTLVNPRSISLVDMEVTKEWCSIMSQNTWGLIMKGNTFYPIHMVGSMLSLQLTSNLSSDQNS